MANNQKSSAFRVFHTSRPTNVLSDILGACSPRREQAKRLSASVRNVAISGTENQSTACCPTKSTLTIGQQERHDDAEKNGRNAFQNVLPHQLST